MQVQEVLGTAMLTRPCQCSMMWLNIVLNTLLISKHVPSSIICGIVDMHLQHSLCVSMHGAHAAYPFTQIPCVLEAITMWSTMDNAQHSHDRNDPRT